MWVHMLLKKRWIDLCVRHRIYDSFTFHVYHSRTQPGFHILCNIYIESQPISRQGYLRQNLKHWKSSKQQVGHKNCNSIKFKLVLLTRSSHQADVHSFHDNFTSNPLLIGSLSMWHFWATNKLWTRCELSS